MSNQPPPLVDYDVLADDAALVDGLRRFGATPDQLDGLGALGRLAGSAQAQQWATEANTHPPVLRTHDRYGERSDTVDFHPSWHRLIEVSLAHGLHSSPWTGGTHLHRAAGFYLWSQAEAGHGCPVSMTYAAVPALRHAPQIAEEWVPRLVSTCYDPGPRPPATKAGCLAGMGMTERQGGSDLRGTTTRAAPLSDGYAIDGHKWFLSAPMSDLFLVLARARGGLSCFALPRVLPDGTLNGFHLQRLKDKLGNRSNASAEVELHGAWGQLVGEEGRGVRTILDMVTATRLDCVIGSAAGMRRAVAEATHHATYRCAFGSRLTDAPLMQAVLADLAVESEAATTLALRLAAALDDDDAEESAFLRLALPVAKFWVCKRYAPLAAEALECLGGNGYIEDSGMPRLYREAPLNSIWEGSGNVTALDVLRALRTRPEALQAYLAEIALSRGADRRLDAAIERLLATLSDLGDEASAERQARHLTEQLAVVLQASLLVRFAPDFVADAFCAARLEQRGLVFGALPSGCDPRAIVRRATPTLPA